VKTLKARKTITFLIWALALSSCYLSTTTQTSIDQPQWVKNWLIQSNENCHIPCFQGITPGMTTIQQAQLDLKNSEDIRQVSNILNDTKTGVKVLEWEYSDSGGGILWSRRDADIAILIRIGFSKTSDITKYGVKISDVISSKGSPSSVLINECQMNTCSVSVIYMEKGMLLNFLAEDGYSSNNQKIVTIKSNHLLDTISFFPGGEDSLLRSYIQEWIILLTH
jgi:hypothetical protein